MQKTMLSAFGQTVIFKAGEALYSYLADRGWRLEVIALYLGNHM